MLPKNDTMDSRIEYLKSNLSPLLEPLLLDLLAQRPPNPLEFMIDWLVKKRGAQQKPCEEDKKSSAGRLNKKFEKKTTLSEDDEDDIMDDLPIVKRKTGITRKAISAEAYGVWNKKENFIARVIPKTEEQKARSAPPFFVTAYKPFVTKEME